MSHDMKSGEGIDVLDDVIRREDCRLCQSKNLKLVLKLEPTPLADSYIPEATKQSIYPLDLYLCEDCGFTQLLDVVQPQVIYFDYLFETKTSLGLVEHFGRYADEVLQKIKPAQDSLVVDIGSNDGSLLQFFKKQDMKVLGVDPAREIARKATEEGVETLAELFSEELGRSLREERGAASIITVNNLFANVDNLIDMTAGIRGWLAEDGVFVFESFYLVDQIENMVFDFSYHEHISYFSVKPLAAFFKSQGMELFDVKRVPTKGGSLRYFIQIAGGPRKVTSEVQDLIDLETSLNIHQPEAFKKFEEKINQAKENLLSLLDDIHAKGQTVAAYGASATSTTMIYHFDLTKRLSFIIDDNPQRQGLFSPGCHIPVKSPEDIYKEKPDYILVLAWRYYKAIMTNHKNYTDEGGRFIIPLPELEIL